ncbi:DegT/DnrJ/EryC1/StrS family aminotransferase [Parapedobacter pyrenivorans]|nr:DegT/DnrJ/EryC1/StrS family aminotransferase [Parapedobacter pyrenivorans]
MDTQKNNGRRDFLRTGALLGATVMASPLSTFSSNSSSSSKPAILGGRSIWSDKQWPQWPRWNPETDERRLLEVVRSGVWSRGRTTAEFEQKWAAMVGTDRSLAVVNGTNALATAINSFGIGPGDEVLVPPYTFIATVSAILFNGAMPVFVDVDPATFQIDPRKMAAKITSKTKAILPVHILGLPADMDAIMAIAKQHKLLVIEDACQAHLAEYGGRKVGSIGHAGCFSFQNSKNLPIGEGGAITSNDQLFMDRCSSYHSYGLPAGSFNPLDTGMLGSKLRFTEYQAAIGLVMLERLQEETDVRHSNATYLAAMISEIPGITPYQLYPKVDKGAFHLFPFRYDPSGFSGLSRDSFLTALRAEGVPCSGGYVPLNTQPFIQASFNSPLFQQLYPGKDVDFQSFTEKNQCPLNDKLCEEAVWLTQNMLLGPRTDMDEIAMAIGRIHHNAADIVKSLPTN